MAATLRFHKEFYSHDAIAESIAEWEQVGSFSLNGDGAGDAGHHVVTVESLQDGDVDGPEGAEILGEFTNYVLSVEVGKRRK